MGAVLIIDDNYDFGLALKDLLERVGYRVHTAATGVEGLAVLGTYPVSLVVTDMVLENLGGVRLVRRIREKGPDTDVIAISGYDAFNTPNARRVLTSLGVRRIFAKPLILSSLLSEVAASVLDGPFRDATLPITATRRPA